MGVYAVTGAASGMGCEVARQLRDAGHTVIGVDIQEADVVADLSTPEGRASAARQVVALSGGKLDGAVMAAGLGPAPGPDRPRMIVEVNYFGVVELLEAWRSSLAAAGAAKVVVISSNSTTTVPMVPRRAVRSLLSGDAGKALRAVRLYRGAAPAMAYAASKIAVTHWVRRQATTSSWAGAGIRLNALAPGAVLTPLLERQLATPKEAKAIHAFPVPVGGFGDPQDLAQWAVFMLSDTAKFLCGSVLFVDGGSDAYFRPESWPKSMGPHRLPGYLWRMWRFSRRPGRKVSRTER